MANYFLILIGTVSVNYIELAKILGSCPFMGVFRADESRLHGLSRTG
jgi:Na+-translocating ferredoxin:NAD+ oxidoreductase RnfA subunit